MEQLIEFAGNHLLLVMALFVISGALAWNLIAGGGKNNIPPSDPDQHVPTSPEHTHG